MGLKGSGKTKRLVEMVSNALETESGSIVCIEKDKKLTYDIPYQARLIFASDYSIGTVEFFKGLLSGLHAGNYDITHFFIDDLNKILDDRSNEALEKFLTSLEQFGARENVDFTITINADPDAAGAGLRKYF